MSNKNPYENNDSEELRKFSSKKDDSIDMSFFKTSQDENTEELEEDEFYDDEEAISRIPRVALFIGVGAIIVLLISTIVGIVFGISQGSKVNAIRQEYSDYATQVQKEIADYKQTISDQVAQIEELKAELEGGSPVNKGEKYVSSVNNVKIRVEPVSGEVVGTVSLGEEITVTETKVFGNNTWAKMEKGWVCIVYEGSNWFVKK